MKCLIFVRTILNKGHALRDFLFLNLLVVIKSYLLIFFKKTFIYFGLCVPSESIVINILNLFFIAYRIPNLCADPMPSFSLRTFNLMNLYFFVYFRTSFAVPSGELSSMTRIFKLDLNLLIS